MWAADDLHAALLQGGHERRASVCVQLGQGAARGEILGVLESAKSVDELAVREMEGRATRLAGKKVTLEVKVDEELIGGVRIRIGNTLYDGSVATAIEDLHRRLMDAPI